MLEKLLGPVDARRVGFEGHSSYGKATTLAMALVERPAGRFARTDCLCAPHPVFVSAGAAAGPVYKLLGKRDLGTNEFPAIETGLMECS